MISLIHLLSIKARSSLPLSQERGSIDTETVAATRFAALLSVYSRVNPKINWGDNRIVVRLQVLIFGCSLVLVPKTLSPFRFWGS